jgi:hypothetical protein
MPYCAQCGVEVNNGVDACPLCGFSVPILSGEAVDPSPYPEIRLPADSAPGTRRRLIWQVFTLILAVSFAIVLSSDLVKHEAITWSRYALSALGLVWLCATFALIFFRHAWLVYLGWFLSMVGFLALVDLGHEGLFWFLPLGLPMAGMAFASMALMHLLYHRGLRGALWWGCIAILLIVLSFGLDLLISGFLGAVSLTWSFIVLSIGGPLAVFLFYYHFRLGRRIDLKRVFHV